VRHRGGSRGVLLLCRQAAVAEGAAAFGDAAKLLYMCPTAAARTKPGPSCFASNTILHV
jgi:hypothetical protein